MANKAVLKLDGEHQVDNVSFSLSQNVDYRNGKPVAEVAPGQISLEVRVKEDNIKMFWEWAMDRKMKKDGSIQFFKLDEDSPLFELSFKEAFCVGFSSHMSSSSSSDMTINISIAARVLDLAGIPMEMTW